MANAKGQKPPRLLELTISASVRRRLEHLLKAYPIPSAKTVSRYLGELIRLVAELDIEILSAILRFASDPESESALLIRNSPLGKPLPKTPLTGDREPKPNHIPENFLIGLSLLLGRPIAFPREKKGELVANLVAVPGLGTSVSNAGYLVPLDLHADLVHLGDNMPAFVLLLCLRRDPTGSAKTFLVDARDVLASLDKRDIEILRNANFRIELPESFIGDLEGERFSSPMPVISGPDFAPQINGEFNSTIALNEPARHALDALKSAARQPGLAQVLELQEGDCIVLRNRAVLHGRSCYQPQFDTDERRWLQRTYVMADTWQARHAMRNSAFLLDGAFL
jgi:L-asparagine oxygenase